MQTLANALELKIKCLYRITPRFITLNKVSAIRSFATVSRYAFTPFFRITTEDGAVHDKPFQADWKEQLYFHDIKTPMHGVAGCLVNPSAGFFGEQFTNTTANSLRE